MRAQRLSKDGVEHGQVLHVAQHWHKELRRRHRRRHLLQRRATAAICNRYRHVFACARASLESETVVCGFAWNDPGLGSDAVGKGSGLKGDICKLSMQPLIPLRVARELVESIR